MIIVPFMTTSRVCFFLTLCVCMGFVCPRAVQAQDISENIVYEQTGPPQWDPIEAANGFPEESPLHPKADKTAVISDEESSGTDIYDSLDDYNDDYLSSRSKSSGGVTSALSEKTHVAVVPEKSGACLWMNSHYLFLVLSAAGILLTLLVIRIFFLPKSFNSDPANLPSMGQLIGELSINTCTKLYYVKTGEEVLVRGVTPQHISLITKLQKTTLSSFVPVGEQETATNTSPIQNKEAVHHTELALLRDDIQALQRAIEELRHQHL